VKNLQVSVRSGCDSCDPGLYPHTQTHTKRQHFNQLKW